jgi:Fe-S-cluster containining protein
MTGPGTFEDDEDTVPTCTGACCDPVRMRASDYRDISLRPGEVRNARYVLNMLTAPGPVPRDGAAEFDCRYFDRESRRCIAYDRRPEMCREFPYDGLCHLCGGRFSTGKHPEVPAPSTEERSGSFRQAAIRDLMYPAAAPSAKRARQRKGR